MTKQKINKPDRTDRNKTDQQIDFENEIKGENLVTVTYKIKESQRDFLREKAHTNRTSASKLVRIALEGEGIT